MAKENRRDKTLFELHPDLEASLEEHRKWLKKNGLLGKFKITE